MIAILFSGRPLIVPKLVAQAQALLAAWFPGSEAGHGLADLIIGAQSPTARTPITWPLVLGQVPIFYAERPTGRPADPKDHFTSKYIDVPNEPAFPFGHGLTYGRFAFAKLRAEPAAVRLQDQIEVSVELANEGEREAEETVFLFTHPKVASVARPVLELKGFCKVRLRPGERGLARLPLAASELRYVGRQLELTFEPGDVEILVGPCADRAKLLTTVVRLMD